MKAVIFDLDDTLYDQSQPFRRAVAELMDLDADQVTSLYLRFRHYADAIFHQTATGQMDLAWSHLYRMQAAFADMGLEIEEELALAIQERYSYYQGHLELEEDWKELLGLCQQEGYSLGLITNGPHLHQLKKIQALKLDQWMDEDKIIISGQVGLTKPDKAIFQLMEERLGLAPTELVYVGDSFENDVVGSKNAGWQVIWYNHRKRKPKVGTACPDWEVASLAELTSILKTWKQ